MTLPYSVFSEKHGQQIEFARFDCMPDAVGFVEMCQAPARCHPRAGSGQFFIVRRDLPGHRLLDTSAPSLPFAAVGDVVDVQA